MPPGIVTDIEPFFTDGCIFVVYYHDSRIGKRRFVRVGLIRITTATITPLRGSSGYSVECAAGTITGSAGHGVIFEVSVSHITAPGFCLGDAYGLRFGAFVRQCDGAGTFLALICVYCERNAVDVVNE